MITVYGIPNCDTVKRARAWLAGQGLEVAFHDFKKQGVPAELLLPGWRPSGATSWSTAPARPGASWTTRPRPPSSTTPAPRP